MPMQNKFLLPIALLSFLILSAVPVQATEIAENGTPIRKLQRGFLNIALSPIEISTQMAKVKNEEHVLPTWATGFGLGSVMMVERMLAGAYEVVTAPFPLPEGYAPIVEPEFPWQHFDEVPAK